MLRIIPIAIFWACSPLTIIVGIMFLSGSRGLLKGLVFVLPGIVISITVGIAVLLSLNVRDFSQKTTASHRVYISQLVMALLFFALAFFWWRIQSRREKQTRLPKWVQFIDSFRLRRVLLIGLYECVSDVIFTAAAVADILLARISSALGVLMIVLFVLLGMAGLWIPVFVRIVQPRKSAERLESMRLWLVANTQLILIIEFAFLGLIEAGKGLIGLLS
jgi:Sap, sulfolipid-1-addressing protein